MTEDITPAGLIELLRDAQHARCAYGTREGDGRTCDCKFDLNPPRRQANLGDDGLPRTADHDLDARRGGEVSTEDTTPAVHVHDWHGRLPHPFEHCCTDNWNQRRICVCGLSEGNRKAHR